MLSGIVTAVYALGSNAIMNVMFNSILSIAERIFSARVRCVVLKGSSTSSMAVCLLIVLDAYMTGHSGGVDSCASVLKHGCQ